uniref:Uncharacterized protein n=1 Tax=Siphoviridae sp. ctxYv12 TaxID=2827974 RepID=A0A8S5S487_9CAUD|nr:MAG TPA: hypothetical protein [Siphoviridae sp. ctxYv12]
MVKSKLILKLIYNLKNELKKSRRKIYDIYKWKYSKF